MSEGKGKKSLARSSSLSRAKGVPSCSLSFHACSTPRGAFEGKRPIAPCENREEARRGEARRGRERGKEKEQEKKERRRRRPPTISKRHRSFHSILLSRSSSSSPLSIRPPSEALGYKRWSSIPEAGRDRKRQVVTGQNSRGQHQSGNKKTKGASSSLSLAWFNLVVIVAVRLRVALSLSLSLRPLISTKHQRTSSGVRVRPGADGDRSSAASERHGAARR